MAKKSKKKKSTKKRSPSKKKANPKKKTNANHKKTKKPSHKKTVTKTVQVVKAASNPMVNILNKNVKILIELFSKANEQILDTGDDEIFSRLDVIQNQNEKIAEAILTVADMITELKDEIHNQHVENIIEQSEHDEDHDEDHGQYHGDQDGNEDNIPGQEQQDHGHHDADQREELHEMNDQDGQLNRHAGHDLNQGISQSAIDAAAGIQNPALSNPPPASIPSQPNQNIPEQDGAGQPQGNAYAQASMNAPKPQMSPSPGSTPPEPNQAQQDFFPPNQSDSPDDPATNADQQAMPAMELPEPENATTVETAHPAAGQPAQGAAPLVGPRQMPQSMPQPQQGQQTFEMPPIDGGFDNESMDSESTDDSGLMPPPPAAGPDGQMPNPGGLPPMPSTDDNDFMGGSDSDMPDFGNTGSSGSGLQPPASPDFSQDPSSGGMNMPMGDDSSFEEPPPPPDGLREQMLIDDKGPISSNTAPMPPFEAPNQPPPSPGVPPPPNPKGNGIPVFNSPGSEDQENQNVNGNAGQ